MARGSYSVSNRPMWICCRIHQPDHMPIWAPPLPQPPTSFPSDCVVPSQAPEDEYIRPTPLSGIPTTPIVLYQYEVCPFCCKAKAALDFYKVGRSEWGRDGREGLQGGEGQMRLGWPLLQDHGRA